MRLPTFSSGPIAWMIEITANPVDALKKQLAVKARVKRNPMWREVKTAHLVPGGTIRLRVRDAIPADVVLPAGAI